MVPRRESLLIAAVDPRIGYAEKDFQFGWNYMAFNDAGWPLLI